MTEKIEIVVTGDAKALVDELKRAGVQVRTFGEETEKSKKGPESLGGQMKGLARELGLMYGLAEVTGMVKDFATASIAAARESAASEAQLVAALTSTEGAAGKTKEELMAYASSLQNVTNYSDEAVQGGQSLLLTFKNIKGDTFDQATAAILDMSQAMGTDLKSSAIQVGKALNDPVEGLSALSRVGVQFTADQEKMIKAMVEAGDVAGAQGVILAELESQFGGSAAAARDAAGPIKDLEVAYGDLQEEFGNLLLAMADTGAMDVMVDQIKAMTEGAKGWGEFINLAKAITSTGEAADEAAGATTKYALGTELATRWLTMGVLSAEDLERVLTDGTTALLDYTGGWDELAAAVGTGTEEMERAGTATEDVTLRQAHMSKEYAEAYKESSAQRVESMEAEKQAAIEAAEAQQEIMMSLATTSAGYYISLRELQGSAIADEQSYNDSISAIRASGAEAQASAASELAETLVALEQEKADKLAWVMTGAHARTAEENARDLEYWSQHYDTLKNEAIAKTKEKTDGILAEQQRSEAAAAAGREAEKAAMQAHLDELKLQTALSVMETTGQLAQMTGLVGISAADAAELINSGVLPMTQEMGLAIQETMAQMETTAATATQTAADNQIILQEALTGTLMPLDEINRRFGEGMPETVGLAQESALAFTDGFTTGVDNVNASAMTLDASMLKMTEETLPGIDKKQTEISATMIKQFGLIKTASDTANSAMVTGFNNSANAADDLNNDLRLINNWLKDIESAAREAERAIKSMMSARSGLGSDSALQGNVGFAEGTDGWRTVPGGYPNDSFLMGLTSGERFAVIPPGGGGMPALPMVSGASGGSTGGGLVITGDVIINGVQNPQQFFEAVEREARARGKQFAVVH